MAAHQNTRIPLDDAHEIFFALGIGPESAAYQRWRREDGFDRDDLEAVMNDSPFVLAVDWREWLQDAVNILARQLGTLGFTVAADLDEDGVRGTLTINGTNVPVKYVPADDDDFDSIISAINRVISPKARYRKLASWQGADGWCYVILPSETWQHIASVAESTAHLLFTDSGVA